MPISARILINEELVEKPMFDIGQLVKYKGTENKFMRGKTYRIAHIRRGIDGAYDWDDLTLEGAKGKFCEFDFEAVND